MKGRLPLAVRIGIALTIVLAVWMGQVFSGQIILNPVIFHLGPIVFKWYGLIMASAIALGYAWSHARLVANNVDPEQADQLLWWVVIAGIIGARLGFVLQNVPYYAAHPFDVLAVNQGGLSIHGAVVCGAIVAWITARKVRIPFIRLADILAPSILLGAVIGRFGNFMNYELYGYPTNVAWKMFVPLAYRLPGYQASAFFHPTFLYEALMNVAMLGIVVWFERRISSAVISNRVRNLNSVQPTRKISRVTRNDKQYGEVFWLTIGLYSVSRFIVEFFRIGAPFANGLTLAQWVSLLVILCSAVVISQREMEQLSVAD